METGKEIKASWLRVHVTLAAVAALKRLRLRQSSVLLLTHNIYVKYGRLRHLFEAASIQFIAANTRIPVPKIYCAFERKGVTYIVMSRIPGSPIGHEWGQRAEESKRRLLERLRSWVQQMRSLRVEVNELIQKQDTSEYGIRFTHGDLSSLNILVEGDDITGIVDWETASWYPEYWEYTATSNVNVHNEFWNPEVDKVL